MKRKSRKDNSLYKYLEPYLETGDEGAIREARKKYIREYKANWRKEKRRREKEITTSWKEEELLVLKIEAKRHKTSITSFVKKCTLAYMDKRYIVPDQLLVRKIAQLLGLTYNSIREMMDERVISSDMGKVLSEQIAGLEREVLTTLHNPKPIDRVLMEIIQDDPKQKRVFTELLETA